MATGIVQMGVESVGKARAALARAKNITVTMWNLAARGPQRVTSIVGSSDPAEKRLHAKASNRIRLCVGAPTSGSFIPTLYRYIYAERRAFAHATHATHEGDGCEGVVLEQ